MSVTDPRSNGVGFTSYFATLDQGSVLVVGKVINKITFQPEYVPPI